MAARKAEALGARIEIGRPGALDDRLQHRNEERGADEGCRDRARQPPAPVPADDRDHGERQGCKHLAVAEHGHRNHDLVECGRAQALHIGAHRLVGAGEFRVEEQVERKRDETRRRPQRDDREQEGRQNAVLVGEKPVEDPDRPAVAVPRMRQKPVAQRLEPRHQPLEREAGGIPGNRQKDGEKQERLEKPRVAGRCGVDRAAHPHARQQVRRRPDEGRDHVDHREARRVHAHDAGYAGHHRLYPGYEPADEDALAAVTREIALALVEQAGIAAERPDGANPFLVVVPEPVGHRVAGDRTQRSRQIDRQEVEPAEPDHRPGADKDDGGGDEQPDDEQRFTRGHEEDDGDRLRRVVADEVDELLEEVGEHVRSGIQGNRWSPPGRDSRRRALSSHHAGRRWLSRG